MTASLVAGALKAGRAERLSGEIEYIRFRDSHAGVERGTVIAGKKAIRGYPHIKRIFTLENGLKRNMRDAELHAEEKIDGFNVRVASVGGRVFAFSRGGFLDAFVTEKARDDKGIAAFFRDNPDSILCCEMIGNTPYTAPAKDFDVMLFVFDIGRGPGAYLPCAQRYALVKKYGMRSVPVLGKFRSDDYAGLRKAILALNKGKKEGMVLKGATCAVKYVTPWSDIEDIANGSGMLFDMPIGFFHQRVLRSAFFIKDFGLGRDEYALELGRAFYDGLEAALKRVQEGGDAGDEFEISVRDPKIWDDIHRHMSHEVRLEELWTRKENGRTRIRFRKIYKKTTKTLASYANGKGITD
ncbi:MAG: RNA ligase [Candidatus ainarchaeum sp.]|nr:RNA ligase [Candidatus ainarchaeum sp.]